VWRNIPSALRGLREHRRRRHAAAAGEGRRGLPHEGRGHPAGESAVARAIDFEIAVESSDIDGELLGRVIARAGELSPVWIAIKGNVEVSWRHSVMKREK